MNTSPLRSPLISLLCLTMLCGCSSNDRDAQRPRSESEMEGQGDFTMPTPGPEHAWLATRAGHWSVTSKMRMTPDGPWSESTAEEWAEVVAGGFWVVSKQVGSFLGMPFEGRATNGYDQVRKMFVGSWVDNFGSSLTTFEGQQDPITGDLIMWSDMLDPAMGKTMRVKMVSRHVDANHVVFEMYMPNPDGNGHYLGMLQDSRRIL